MESSARILKSVRTAGTKEPEEIGMNTLPISRRGPGGEGMQK